VPPCVNNIKSTESVQTIVSIVRGGIDRFLLS